MRFVIIGGDAAGMSAASKAKRNDPAIDVIVFEMTQDVSYSACGMPYNIAEPGRDMDDLVVRKAEVFMEKQNIDLRRGHMVTAIDRGAKKVHGKKSDNEPFEVEYDKLLIATGASPRKPDIPGADLPGVLTLKSLEDGRRIKDYMASHPVNKALILGMGYIGLEMAESLTHRNISVHMAKPGPKLLPWTVETLGDMVKDELESKGVTLHFDAQATRIEEISVGYGMKVALSNNEELQCDMIIVGIGIVPNSRMARDAGLELGPSGSIAVDKAMRTSDPDIYAAGDCADAFHVVTGERVWIPLGLRANRAGWAVADHITGEDVEIPGVVGTAVFKVLDLEVARTGLTMKEAEQAGFKPVQNDIKSRSRAHAHPGAERILINMLGDADTGKLLGVHMVGKEGVAHRINAPAVALHAGMTIAEFLQCDTAYAPPFSPVWDPLLIAANELIKKV
jgi:NADPH-dependent 2,4-dienoyl-CoA reductase/sulfur reductase-like enzyme